MTPSTPAVTVIIAAYRSRERIQTALESLECQTLDPNLFEVLVVINGPDDGTRSHLSDLRRDWPHLRLRCISTPVGNASLAWNLGIDLAAGEYITFLDDDDWISPRYLEVMLAEASLEKIVLAPFGDVTARDAKANFDNYLNRALFKFAGLVTTFGNLPQSSSANCGKIIHKSAVGSVRFDGELRSGMDIAFWSRVIATRRLTVHPLPPLSGAVYYRELRDNSMSRNMTEQFALDRLRVIGHLEQLRREVPSYSTPITNLADAQAGHLGNYVRSNPDRTKEVRRAIDARAYDKFSYRSLNERAAKTLVIAYAFPPFGDTSAMVMARRLYTAGQSFDAVVQDMSNIRSTDEFSESLVSKLIGRKFVVPAPATFGNWRHIARFVTAGAQWVEDRLAGGHHYERLYSRSMFPASHILAALIKARHPNIEWVAEFSDPMRHDSSGAARETEMSDAEFLDEIRSVIGNAFPDLPVDTNMWSWIEDAAFALADEVLFTNDNQRLLMTREAPNLLRARLDEIATVSPHPTLPESFYHLRQSAYSLPSNRVNLGYFGVFYAARGIQDLTGALRELAPELRAKILLHIFTNKPEEAKAEITALGLDDCVEVNTYVPYLEFLNLATHFDWLIVSDARAAETHGINPYLPSKYSDYLGSGTKIAGFVEPGSVLDRSALAAKVSLGDLKHATELLASIAATASPS